MPGTGAHAANGDDWGKWSKFVRLELERLGNSSEASQKDLTEMKVSIAVLKAKAVIWGCVGAAVGTGLLNFLFFLLRKG